MKIKLDRNSSHIKYMIGDTQVPGYSTIASELSKPFLVTWANKEGLKGHDTAKDKTALDIGKLAHFMVECHITGNEPDLDDYAKNDIDKAIVAYNAYLDIEKKHKIVYIKNELPLVSNVYRYGGTCDIYAEVDGVKSLIDLKTSKAIYKEYHIQIAAYRQLLLEHNYEVGNTFIWRIDKEDGSHDDKQIKLTGKEFELFLALKKVYDLRKESKI